MPPAVRKTRASHRDRVRAGNRMHKPAPKPAQEDENDLVAACGHIETDTCWCAIAADNPGRSNTRECRRNPQKSASIGGTINLNPSDTERLCVLAHYFKLGLKEVFRRTAVSACWKGLGVWHLVDGTKGEPVVWLQQVMEFMARRRKITTSPVYDGTPIDKDPFPRIPQLQPIFELMSKETVNLQEGTFNDRSLMGRCWFAHGFIPAFFKVLSLGTSDDRAMLANVMKTPTKQRKLCVYTLLRMAVFSKLDNLDRSALNVGDASLQLSPGTDHEADLHVGLTPMDIDSSSPPEMTCSYSTVAEESTARQPSAPPDSTQRQRQASGDNDGEEHTYRGGGGGGGGAGGYEVMVTYSARDDIVAGAVRGGAASLPPQGYAPAKPSWLSMTHTSAANPYNGLDHETQLNKIHKMILNQGIRLDKQTVRLDKQTARLDDQTARLDDQDTRLDKHETRLDKHDTNFQSLQGDIRGIKSMLEKDQNRRRKEEVARKKGKVQKQNRRQRNEREIRKHGKALEILIANMKTLIQERSERTPRESGPPAAPTSSFNMSPAESGAEPSNGAGPPPPPADLRSRYRNPRTHGSDGRRHSSNTHITRSMSRAAAHPAH